MPAWAIRGGGLELRVAGGGSSGISWGGATVVVE